MPYNIAPHLLENELGILTAANGHLTMDNKNFGNVLDIENVGYITNKPSVHSKISNRLEWHQQIADERIMYSHENNANLRYIVHSNPTAGASSCFIDYKYPNPHTLATSGRLSGCTALVLVLRNGALSLHAGNDDTVDEITRSRIVNEAGNGSRQRAYRGWIYQLIWKHLESANIHLDPSNANVIANVGGAENFNQFIDSAVFCQRVLELDYEIAHHRNIAPQILWGTLVHSNRDPRLEQPDVEQRAVGEGQRQIYIQTYDPEATASGSLDFLINKTANGDVTVSTLACKWGFRSTRAMDGVMVRSATLTSRRIQQNA